MVTNTSLLRSAAFYDAELRSERLRIVILISFFAAFTSIAAIRVFGLQTARVDARFWSAVSLALMVVAFEYWMLRHVQQALNTGEHVARSFWITTTILEAAVPAVALAFLPNQYIEPDYIPVASPALLVFSIFIIMSVLRLSRSISFLAGLSASISYVCAALYVGWKPARIGEVASFTQSGVILNAMTLLLAGIVAAVVTGQLRKHVEAALCEAETKRKLDAIQHDLQIARSIQQSLLPQSKPQVQGFEIAGWNQPADDTGGDYFDWQSLPDGRLIVSLADVTGHGIGPALLASVCRAYARSSFRASPDLMSALENLNQAFGADLTTGRFATFVAAACCPGCTDIQLLSAGHGPVFMYSRSEDRFIEIESHALPLGILPVFNCEAPSRLQLRSGDILVLSTDGFFEWENQQGEEFGVGRAQHVIRNSRDLGPAEIVQQLYAGAREFSHGAKQLDDLTAVVIKRL